MSTTKTKLGQAAEEQVNKTLDRLRALDARLAEIEAAQATLKAAGLTYAGEHLRDGKYLYLVYPSQNGEPRKREYIGTDPVKQQEARAGIERGREYNRLAGEAERIEKALRAAAFQLTQIAYVHNPVDRLSYP